MRLYPGSDVEKLLVANNISCMASGSVGNQVKYYFFAQKVGGTFLEEKSNHPQGDIFFMVEIIISLTSYELVAKIRCRDSNAGEEFTEHLESVLNQVADKSA